MKQGTMKVLFFALKSRLLKNGEAPIILCVTIDGQSEEAHIQSEDTCPTFLTLEELQ